MKTAMKPAVELEKQRKIQSIPVNLTEEQFKEFVLPYLSQGKRGPKPKLSLFVIFNYILYLIHTGMQWMNLPIALNACGKKEIHYTRLFRLFQRWSDDGSLERVFENSVGKLTETNLLDISVLHGDGSSTAAKKGGDTIGYNGHKHFKGDKVIAIVDRNVNVIAPYVQAPGNRNETVLLEPAIAGLKKNNAEI